MEQYIPKSAVVAEIERLVNNYDKALDYEAALEDVRNFLDTLEVKEVDLKKVYRDYINCDNGHTKFEIAVHFFELGMQVSNKAQKGE